MYKKGQLQIDAPCEKSTTGEPCKHEHAIRSDSPTAYLPHSCDEWEIGGTEEIQAMIDDLLEALEKIEVLSAG